MTVVGRFLQSKRDPRPNPLWGVTGQPDLHGDRVSGPKADALDVASQPIGVFDHDPNRAIAIGLEDAHGP